MITPQKKAQFVQLEQRLEAFKESKDLVKEQSHSPCHGGTTAAHIRETWMATQKREWQN